MIKEIESLIEQMNELGLEFVYLNNKKYTKHQLYSLLSKEKKKPEEFQIIANFSDKVDKSNFYKKKIRKSPMVLCQFETSDCTNEKSTCIKEASKGVIETTWSFFLNLN